MSPPLALQPNDARRAALRAFFDHAALFPPASLAAPDALAEDRRVRSAPESWLVHRFVCPLSRVGELGEAELPLSLVLDEEPDDRLEDPRVGAVEVPPGRSTAGLTDRLEVYVERPLGDLRWLEATAEAGHRAKVRCGGAAVPEVAELAAFIRRCRELALPFKATAGLHHPLRGAEEHGFLNLLAAAVCGDEDAALAERDPSAFGLDEDGFEWRGHRADAEQLGRIRRELLVAVGSCSIREPVEGLRSLGILPA